MFKKGASEEGQALELRQFEVLSQKDGPKRTKSAWAGPGPLALEQVRRIR